jgi:hypothetical protein
MLHNISYLGPKYIESKIILLYNLLIFRVMLNSAPGALVKHPKKGNKRQ